MDAEISVSLRCPASSSSSQWHKHWQMTKEEEDQTLLAKEGADRDENTASRAALFSVHMKAMGIGTWTGNVLQVFPTSY